jgi:hypothetical protein
VGGSTVLGRRAGRRDRSSPHQPGQDRWRNQGREFTPTIDGWFDRISLEIDPTLGLGADFRLAERGYKDYPGMYTMVEIDQKDWGLLPPVEDPGRSAAIGGGGTSLFGGRGSIVKTLWGVLLLVVINNGMDLQIIDPDWKQIATGVVLIAALGSEYLRRRVAESRATAELKRGSSPPRSLVRPRGGVLSRLPIRHRGACRGVGRQPDRDAVGLQPHEADCTD